ncbi:lysozyme [Citrobacter freundii]|uniref:lysozyme n=1 Tax=Citrobacter freundii TaxID=546 RepID=UPI001A318C68|nr:lysozyme [Citrobacter freundii]WHE73214.1 lysozyme [Citrobacter freundii]WHE78106.1 lysozyme [Citrobacter freundii]HAT3934857.1 lysozyme [Citrobacter freundii]HAT3940051.1 lysozyme [Citrobacter freundii]
MEMSKNGLTLLKSFEGCELTAYQDAVGVWTIGYGWTQPVNGKPVGRGMTITQDTADSLLCSGVVQYEKGVTGLVKVAVNQNQFDALVDFAYNLGVKALEGSTLLKKLNAGDSAGAADEFPKWNKAGGKVLNGLVKRRAAERSLFLS